MNTTTTDTAEGIMLHGMDDTRHAGRIVLLAARAKEAAAELLSWVGTTYAERDGMAHKVWLDDVRRALGFADRALFGAYMVAAHRAGLLTLCRSDLPQYNPDAAAASEVLYLCASYHFIRL